MFSPRNPILEGNVSMILNTSIPFQTAFPPHSKNPLHFESSNGDLFSHPQRMVPEAKEKNEKKEKVGKQTKKGSNWKSMKSMILRNPIESKKKWIKHRVHYD